jgi:hypothetical protein
MKLAQTNLSKLKACRKLASGKAPLLRSRHPWLTSDFVTTLKGLQISCSRIFFAPFQGAGIFLNRFPGYHPLARVQPWANFRQPFRLLQMAEARI